MSDEKQKKVKEILEKINSLKQETVTNVHKINLLKQVLFNIGTSNEEEFLSFDIGEYDIDEYMIEIPKYEI